VLREYAQAGILFEKMACESLDNTLTRFNAPQYFLCSGLAFLAFVSFFFVFFFFEKPFLGSHRSTQGRG
jgi:hypothetical protein